jgi:hypothetical protein
MATRSFTRVDSVIDSSTHELPLKTTLSDLCDDVLLLICSHLSTPREYPWKNLSLTNRRLHSLLAPQLFKTLHINAPLSSKNQDTLTRLHAHTLRVNMFGSLWWWCSGVYVNSIDAVDLFRFIRRLGGLKTLEVSMMSRSLDIFEAAFREEGNADIFSLPRVEKLVVTSTAAFLARHCPNLRSLVMRDERDCMVEPYVSLQNRFSPAQLQVQYGEDAFRINTLRSFDATATFSPSEVLFLTTSFPSLTHLTMRSETYCYRASVPTIISLLAHLPHLHSLRLSKISHLDMGYRSVWKRAIQECETAETRKVLWEENERARVDAEDWVGRLAFGGIGGLRRVWVGERRVARKLQGYGEEKVRWMWEREREDTDDSMTWAGLREEKESVVIRREVGW